MKFPNVLLLALLIVFLTNFTKSDIAIYDESTDVQQISVKHELLRFRTEKLLNNTFYLRLADPPNGCSKMYPPPKPKYKKPKWILMMDDSVCDMNTKITNAQTNGYHSLIIASNSSNAKIQEANEHNNTSKYKINVSFISYADGLKLEQYKFKRNSIKYIVRPTKIVESSYWQNNSKIVKGILICIVCILIRIFSWRYAKLVLRALKASLWPIFVSVTVIFLLYGKTGVVLHGQYSGVLLPEDEKK